MPQFSVLSGRADTGTLFSRAPDSLFLWRQLTQWHPVSFPASPLKPRKGSLALSRGVFSYLRYGQLTDSCHYGPEWELLLSSKTGYSEIIFSILIILKASQRLLFMSSLYCQVFGIASGSGSLSGVHSLVYRAL